MTPVDDIKYLINSVILGEEPSVEDFILFIGTLVAFIAFILWCCFPVIPKDSQPNADSQYRHYKKTDANAMYKELQRS
ncbi:uncharacterized protein LOC119096800 isoform X1 [Pollicipes pollicipes]|nr:uncharacterized protein LOC119096199 isoform X2 [Pollicipes pollicipes]XP_037074886.1 uncharacterized protein LOC119096199 isoform X2 [Pollicipes pollicipes]XP_037074887.1 uncharacterized protein LOC119096199 isoform X2 [Pollicipes pollicipes]XP_037074888.1 uncharacterized protein LOC119096199 isoform X2 [Pollicipes pollicipes]XP_037075634.1 uncharacterized protein LOC119096800 isoform X1 [Pollicipes pollicipes]XP_037075636.1 uncharacterized protein LOC119096800 isoform X1 [Pollicipes polli